MEKRYQDGARLEISQLKQCSDCGENLESSEFYLCKSGLYWRCKTCCRIRRKEYYQRNWKQELAVNATWREANRKYERHRSKELNIRCSTQKKKSHQKWEESHPEANKAHCAVYQALKRGQLVKPRDCQRCGRVDLKIHSHHHKGYERKLDIEWICASCHRSEHTKPKYEVS